MHDDDLRIPDPIVPLEPARPVQHIARAFGDINSLAVDFARMHGLLQDDGQILCWECKRLGATLPELHCRRCYAIVKARPPKPVAREQRPEPAPRPAPVVAGRQYRGER